jgi:hypothetical protein
MTKRTKSFAEFEAAMMGVENEAEEAETMNREWWANNPPAQGWVPEFKRPDWNVQLALRLAKLYFNAPNGVYREMLAEKIDQALEPGPNDAHMGSPRW